MKKDLEKKVNNYIKKLEKAGLKLSDVTDKDKSQLLNTNAFNNFEKLAKRKLERAKIIADNKKYDEKLKKKIEKANEKVFQQYPWAKQVMKFDDKYKNLIYAKDVVTRKLGEEQKNIIDIIDKYFDKRNKTLKKLIKDLKKEKNIDVLVSVAEKLEYVIQAYGEEDKNNGKWYFELENEEIIEKIHSLLISERLIWDNKNMR